MSRSTALAIATFALAGGPALAATLDFTELGSGRIEQAAASVSGANLFSGGGALFVGAGGVVNSICALDVAVNSCANTLLIAFQENVTNLSFTVGGFDVDLDAVSLSILDAMDQFVGSIAIAGNGRIDLATFGTVGALLFDTVATEGNGASYGDFAFDVAPSPMPAVPLPAGLPLLVGALGVMGLAGRRRAG